MSSEEKRDGHTKLQENIESNVGAALRWDRDIVVARSYSEESAIHRLRQDNVTLEIGQTRIRFEQQQQQFDLNNNNNCL